MIQLTLQDQILQHLYKPQGPSLLQTLKAHNFVIFDFIFVMQLSLDPITLGDHFPYLTATQP